MEQTHRQGRGRARVVIATAVVASLAGAAGWRYLRRPVASAGPEWPVAQTPDLLLREGRLTRPDSGQAYTGWLVEKYGDGALRSKSFISNGVLEGISEGWHTNGIRQVREFFVAGKSEGTVTKWSADGLLVSVGTAHEGRLHGKFQRWHTNGVLAEEMELRDGVADGLARSWHASGHPRAEVRLEQGKVVSRRYWDDGQPVPSVAGSVSAPAGGGAP